ncbi:MAG: hypothetical protein MK089_03925 [Phycisphaerales bacterium]|nr:hypothetical protein [Phycisphaerales bacterium]
MSMDQTISNESVNRYGGVMFTLLAMMLICLFAMQFIVDPLGIFDTRIDRFDKHRSMHSRIAKAEAANRRPHDTVLLGSSRFEAGFDPDDQMWGDADVLNFSLAGANFIETRQAWELLEQTHPPQRLLIDVSLFTLNTGVGPADDYALSRLIAMEPSSRNETPDWLDTIRLTTPPGGVSLETRLNWVFGLPQIRKAVGAAIRGLREPESNRYTNERGFGIRLDRADDNRHWFEKSLADFMQKTESYNGFELAEDRMEMLKEIVEEAVSLDIQVDIVMPPVHVTQLEVMDRMGLSQAYDKLRLAVTELAAAYPSKVRAWDFSNWSGITAEAITDKTSSPMKYFHESSHFTDDTGSLVLKRLYGDSNEQQLLQQMGGFGTQLLPSSITPYVDQWHQAKEAWRNDNPDIMDWIDGLWNQTASERARRLRVKEARDKGIGGMQLIP